MVATAFAVASALLPGSEWWQTAGDRRQPPAHINRGIFDHNGEHAHCMRVPTFLRGRVDNAKAEELVAGLGFTVDLSISDAMPIPGATTEKPPPSGHRKGRRRRRPAGKDIDGELTPPGKGRVDFQFLEADDFIVSVEDRLAFERNGHAVTRGVLSKAQLKAIRPSIIAAFELQEMEALRQKVSVWFGDEAAFALDTVPQLRARIKRVAPQEVPFLQVFNMFRREGPYRETIEKIVLSPRLAHIAAQLLGCERLRLYQDSTFCKRPGDGPTRWHSDLNMAPLDCNDFVTAWIPLSTVHAKRDGGSPLVFASRSHRDFALNHWQDSQLQQDLTGRYPKKDHAPLYAGDITWHHGWTLHTSPGNPREEARTAFAVSYFRDGTRLLSEFVGRAPDPEDKWSYGDWINELPGGGVVEHAAVPLVWNGGRPLG